MAAIAHTSPTPSVLAEAPHIIRAMEFAQARAAEISVLAPLVKGAGTFGTKRAFQRLPRHLRRRAMSHNIYRLPVRLRAQAKLEEEKSAAGGKKKKRSPLAKVGPEKAKAKFRWVQRRPQNLLRDYNRRQRKFKWLETHVRIIGIFMLMEFLDMACKKISYGKSLGL